MAPDAVLHRLAALGAFGDALQKLCDAEDWTDPRLRLVVRQALGVRPRIQPRQWEYAVAFLALAEAGKLRAESRGIAFGSGREPLTFAVAARVAHLTATDRYEADTPWAVARTADPTGFVMKVAPKGFPADRLAVHHMDMREIGYPDASFDFCYSISAFEHIGEEADFVRHLSEVRRVLKPDGLYALTTEVLLGDASRPTRGNWAFAVADLLRFFAEAGLQAAPVVDMRLSDFRENDPRALASTWHADPASPMLVSQTMRDQAGIPSAPVVFLLRPAEGAVRPVEVRGLEAARAQVEAARRALRDQRFADWVRLNPWGSQPGRERQVLDLWATMPLPAGRPAFATASLEFGAGRAAWQVVATPSSAMAGPAEIAVQVFATDHAAAGERRPVARGVLRLNDPTGAAAVLRLEVPTAPGLGYMVTGQTVAGEVLLAALDVQARRSAAQ